MSEGEIYYYLKNYLIKKGFEILGGEPPDGSDDVKRIEIRLTVRNGIGSKGSYKVDLVCRKNGYIFLIENKPSYSQSDIDKLNFITGEEGLPRLYSALEERCNLKKEDVKKIIKVISNGNMMNKTLPDDFVGIECRGENDIRIAVGDKLNKEILIYFLSLFKN